MKMITYSGKTFDIDSLTPEMIDIKDITMGLASQARFAGQTSSIYTVAQHSVMVARLVEDVLEAPELALHALFHDAHEAYTSDIPTPIKEKLKPLITYLERDIDNAIYKALGLRDLTDKEKAIVKTADQLAFLIEDRDLRDGSQWENADSTPHLVKALEYKAVSVSRDDAKCIFLFKFLTIAEKYFNRTT